MTQANSCAAVKITDLCVCFAAQAATTQQLLFLQGNKMPFFSLQDAATNFHFFYQTVSHEDRHHTIVVSVVGPILFLCEFGKKKKKQSSPIHVLFPPCRKRKPTDDFEVPVKGILDDCSVNMKALVARSAEVDMEANVGNHVAAWLRLLPKKIQCEAINEIHNVLHKDEMSLYE